MIVADTNLLAYLFIQGEFTDSAEKVFQKDPIWAAPLLWRSEFRNVMITCLQKEYITFELAAQIINESERLMKGREYSVESLTILRLAHTGRCSAYDAEYVALARELKIPLVTADVGLQKLFPDTALSFDRFLSNV